MKNLTSTLSAMDLAKIFQVDRQTIYRWRNIGRLPEGILISQRTRRWPIPDLLRHSDELSIFLRHLSQDENTSSEKI
ncbi:MAG: hypothetical protein EBT20_13155 [Alphaproteobacteria bacterium]|nr:hypothetical protein [Alphaproteobacteria bacterium]